MANPSAGRAWLTKVPGIKKPASADTPYANVLPTMAARAIRTAPFGRGSVTISNHCSICRGSRKGGNDLESLQHLPSRDQRERSASRNISQLLTVTARALLHHLHL